MREGAKRRLTGAVVIVALVVIFVPMLFEQPPLTPPEPIPTAIPEQPPFADRFRSESYLAPDEGVDEVIAPRPLPQVQPQAAFQAPREPVPEPMRQPRPQSEPAPSLQARPEPRQQAPATQLPSWVVQVASLGTAAGAAELEARLRAAGYSAFVEQAEVNGKRYYRVRVGPEIDRADAERAATMLRDRQGLETLIQRYP
ncbi:SPOR domain-containing protein [Marichromatium purpuratum]|uniref:SPOR domain-containing protein n=1 Tax=Marichromatium purpuratum TaxID=37487 RepID=UPI00021E6549|nr:SPOR domain-containing protein [Marichromatium purpuratum]